MTLVGFSYCQTLVALAACKWPTARSPLRFALIFICRWLVVVGWVVVVMQVDAGIGSRVGESGSHLPKEVGRLGFFRFPLDVSRVDDAFLSHVA